MFDLQHTAGFLRAGRTGGDKREQRQARDREALSEWLHKPPPFRGAGPLKCSQRHRSGGNLSPISDEMDNSLGEGHAPAFCSETGGALWSTSSLCRMTAGLSRSPAPLPNRLAELFVPRSNPVQQIRREELSECRTGAEQCRREREQPAA